MTAKTLQMSTHADYFDKGCRPFLLQFPPCIARIVSSKERDEPQLPGSTADAWSRSTSFGRDIDTHSDHCPSPRKHSLHSFFDPADVRPWTSDRFQMVGKVQDAARNKGQVHEMCDSMHGKRVAVKHMPNDWVCRSHDDFMRHHPGETERPWVDIGCMALLNSTSFPYGCELLGVYRDEQSTRVVTELASEGDLFSWCGVPSSEPAGPTREALVRPLARQIIDSVKRLHELSIVHRDLSLENILLTTRPEDGTMQIQVIDFGMTSRDRCFRNCVRGKPSYQAPETHTGQECDGFLCDAFAVGVTLYALLMKDYPWLSTRPGGCKCFEFVRRNGFRAYAMKRKLRGSSSTVAESMSEQLLQLLEGLLAVNPVDRLTLGEAGGWAEGSRPGSVWDLAWLNRATL